MPAQVYQPLGNGNGQYLGAVENPPMAGGQQAMEVNRVQDKGKGWKGRGHSKGKGKKGYGKTFGAFGAMQAGKGFRFGRGRGKGKGRGKGRGKGKGKKRRKKARKAEAKAKAKEKVKDLEELFVEFKFVTWRDAGETNAPTNTQLEM